MVFSPSLRYGWTDNRALVKIVSVVEDDAMILTMSGCGKIVSKPGEEDIETKVSRMIEEILRSG